MLLLVGLSFAGILAYRRRRDPSFGLIAALGVIGLVVGFSVHVASRQSAVLIDLALAVVVAVVAAEAIGLPEPVAKRLGVGLRSREWEYDRALARLLRPLNEVLAQAPADTRDPEFEGWRERFLRNGRERLDQLRRHHAPDPEWAALARSYADIYGEIVERISRDPSPVWPARLTAAVDAADEERRRLRAKYRDEAAAVLAESRAARLLRRR